MLVRQAMLESPITIAPNETFEALLNKLIGSRQATAAVLTDEGKLMGVVGIHDVLRKIVPHYVDLDYKLMELLHENYVVERFQGLRHTRVDNFMTRASDVDTVAPDDTLTKAVVIIVERSRKTLPVIENGNFLGMITRRSILEHVGPRLLEPA